MAMMGESWERDNCVPIPSDQLRFFRLIEDVQKIAGGTVAALYTLACGHVLMISPPYPEESIEYLPCAQCVRLLWRERTGTVLHG